MMAYQFGMPVALSQYPNSLVYPKYPNNKLPSPQSSSYRTQFLISYYTDLYERNNHREAAKDKLPNAYKSLMDYDQEHGMFIVEGTKAGLF